MPLTCCKVFWIEVNVAEGDTHVEPAIDQSRMQWDGFDNLRLSAHDGREDGHLRKIKIIHSLLRPKNWRYMNIDYKTGEILDSADEYQIVRKGGLYSPLPIPAYKILGMTRQFASQRVLMCLVAHIGYKQRAVFPSYAQIEALSGVRGNDISGALDDLIDLGFIKIYQYWNNGKKYNKYYIQEACYKPHLMGEKGQKYVDILGLCAGCHKTMRRGEFMSVNGKTRHYVCGGRILLNKRGKKQLGQIEMEAIELD